MIERRGMRTVDRCQNSAPAGIVLFVSSEGLRERIIWEGES